jgi:hypothetical protein
MKTTLLATLLMGVAGLNAAAGVISLNPSTLTPVVGQSFTIDLVLSSNVDTITGIGLNYSVSTAAIHSGSYTLNSGFDFDLSDPSGNPAVQALADAPFSGATLTLASFSFVANSVGQSVFSVTTDLSDLNQGLFELVGANFTPTTLDLTSQITINVVTPEPATFGIGALALAGLFLAARRFA